MNSSSNSNISSKYNLPKFRASSYGSDVNGASANNSFQNVSYILPNRTVSSSSTTISTPSNRKRGSNTQSIKKQDLNGKLSKNGRLIKSKLLNLHQSSKVVTSLIDESQPFNLVNDKYDYSVFTSYPNVENSVPPNVKQSQVNAWESAEQVSKNLIFNDSEDDQSDDEFDGFNHPQIQISEASPNHDLSTNPKLEPSEISGYNREENWLNKIIKSIPGYSKGELEIVLKSYCENLSEAEEKQLIYDYKKSFQTNQEKLFNQSSSLQLKRQIQVNQKKSLLRQFFGYANNLNQNYITNNTSYSSIDNVKNIQKLFHDDKEEINSLIYEKQQFDNQLKLIDQQQVPFDDSHRKRRYKKSDTETEDLIQVQSLASKKLDEIYDSHIASYEQVSDDEIELDLDPGAQDELSQIITKNLRKYIKDNDE